MKKIVSIVKQHVGLLLALCFIVYFFLSWILLLRDGRALYAIANFYPAMLPLIKSIEPYSVQYGINSIPTLLFIGITIISFGIYFLAFRIKMSIKKIVLYSILFQSIMLFSYPSLATDIFSYIMSDRVATVYHKNVWTTKPQEFSSDPFSRLADWQFQPRVYGEVNQIFYNGVSLAGNNDLFLTVFLYKLLVFLFSLVSMYIVYLIAKRFYPGMENFALLTIFWNPLFILEIVGSGHNDMLMIFFTLVGLYFFKDKKWILAALAIGAAVQVKVIILLLFGFLAFSLLLEKRVLAFILFLCSFVVFNAICFYFMQISPLLFLQNISFNVGVYWQSFPLLIHKVYPYEKNIFSVGYIFVIVLLLFYQWKKRVDPFTIYAFSILLYLMFFTTAHWNWYILWILTLVPFLSSRTLKNTIVIFSFTALLSYPIFWLALRFNNELVVWHIVRYFVLCGIPLLAFFYFWHNKKKSLLPDASFLERSETKSPSTKTK